MVTSPSEFRRLLSDKQAVLLGDGAAGTVFADQGLAAKEIPLVPLTDPDRLLTFHLDYLRAGAQVLETHTFKANPLRLEAAGITADVYALNRRAAQIARHARDTWGEPAWILGSMGPLGQPVSDRAVGAISQEVALGAYRAQVQGLLAGGVDGFVVETLSDWGTAEAALTAVREACDLPVALSFAFSVEGTTLFGLTPEEVAARLSDLPGGPPEIVGANCGTGPGPLLDAVLRMAPLIAGTGVRLAAWPNAGQPHLDADGHVRYPAGPLYVARLVPALLAAGAFLVGGCCGTTPEHIRAMRQMIAQPPAHRPPALQPIAPRSEPLPAPAEVPDRSPLEAALEQGHFVVSVELDPPKGVNPRRFLLAAERLAQAGVDAVNVGDSPMARVRMSAIAASSLIRQHTGLDVILHFTTRDRNLMGLESDLLGAHALGIRNVLCLTGDPPGLGDYAKATAVYDLDSVGLVQVLAGLNAGQDGFGHQIGSPARFFIGVGANPNTDNLAREAERVQAKLAAGAQFIMTQPVYDVARFVAWRDAVGPLRVPILLGVMPLVSSKQAEYLHHEVPGIDIPEAVRRRMEAAGAQGEAVGTAIATEFLEQARPLVQGVYLVPSFNRVEPLLPLIDLLRTAGNRLHPSDSVGL